MLKGVYVEICKAIESCESITQVEFITTKIRNILLNVSNEKTLSFRLNERYPLEEWYENKNLNPPPKKENTNFKKIFEAIQDLSLAISEMR